MLFLRLRRVQIFLFSETSKTRRTLLSATRARRLDVFLEGFLTQTHVLFLKEWTVVKTRKTVVLEILTSLLDELIILCGRFLQISGFAKLRDTGICIF